MSHLAADSQRTPRCGRALGPKCPRSQSALCSPQPMRPPTAPEASPRAQGCPLGPRREPSPPGCRRGGCGGAHFALPRVDDSRMPSISQVRAALRRVLQEQSRTIRVPSRVQDTYSKIKRAESALLARSGTHGSTVKAAPLGSLGGGAAAHQPQRRSQVVSQGSGLLYGSIPDECHSR